jgi:O-antigen/teichoic acid export membrane protein
MTIKQKVLTGTKWVTMTNVFRQVLQIVSLIVFARLLSPDDFGIYAILMIFVGFFGMFTDMGTSAALIHLEKPSEKLLSSVFYFNIFVGLILFIVLILLSGPVADFFKTSEVEKLLPLIAFNFIIASFGVVQKALYEKSMNFKNITVIESIAAFTSVLAGICAAVYGFGIYSLIVQTLIGSTVLVCLMWFSSNWRPRWYFSMKEIKKIWSYTVHLSSFNIINYFARNADNFLIGKFLGSSPLGVYSLAYKIMLYPLQNISRVLIRILFPAFSQIQNDNDKFRHAYLRVLFFIALVAFPIMAGLMATADVLVDVLFGDKWKGLAVILMILAPVGMMQSIVTTIGSIYMAKGNTKEMFKIGAINAVVTVIAFFIGISFGVEGVAFSYLMANIIMLYPNLLIAWRQIDLSVKEGVNEIMPIFMISFLMGLIVVIFGQILNSFIGCQIIKLIIMVLGGLILYIGLVRIKYGKLKKLLSELKR